MATGIPEEFFTTLPLYELLKPKNAVNDADFFSDKGREPRPCGKRLSGVLGDTDGRGLLSEKCLSGTLLS